MSPIWQKEAHGGAADWVTRFTVGDDPHWDMMLMPFDAAASLAHAAGLLRIGVLTSEEFEALQDALGRLGDAIEKGEVTITVEDEDCHTVIERFLIEETGDAGRKIHTGRSRNDQVLAALRLWLRQHLGEVMEEVADLAEELADLADDHSDTFLPGYTHTQRAMPSSVGAWALGFAECVADDLTILKQARDLNNASPLGAAAGYGVPHLELDRAGVASDLGFNRVQEHVTAVQLSRGKFEMAAVHGLVQVAATINRLASDIVLYCSAEFGFVRLDEELTTGSSIMPQKKNPDIAELARTVVHRVAAEMQILLTVPANLPSGYHRDLQVTKASVMRSVLMLLDLGQAASGLVDGMAFDTEKLESARGKELFATAAALEQVKGGKPFREAYRDVASKPELWDEQAGQSLSDVYTTPGNPGKTDSKALRKRLDELRP
jgi:argininosuccinate lyase